MNGQGEPRVEGILPIDKPAGLSSARAVAIVKRELPRGTKIGHAGTLDPFATGLLLLLIGRATRLCESLMDLPKRYEAVVRFGVTSPTDDPESPMTPVPGARPISRQELERATRAFVGRIMQRPPAYSAMKVGGRRAYDLARTGRPVDLPPRPVRVDAMELLDFNWPQARLRIDCGRGTYIRSLARDLGESLGCGGCLTELVRAQIGPFTLENATALAEIRDGSDWRSRIIPPPLV